MKKVSKSIKVLCLLLVMLVMLTACSKNMSYTFNVATGDNITVELDASDGYVLKQEEGMFIVCDSSQVDVLQGFFVTKEMYDAYLSSVADVGLAVMNVGQKNGCTYTQYQLITDSHTENNFICWIDGSNTGFVVASVESQKTAEEAFDKLSFSH